jgi:hypothetical protein
MKGIPAEFTKDYKQNYKQLGHDRAAQIVRSRITFSLRYGHAWYMQHRKEIEKALADIESSMEKKL